VVETFRTNETIGALMPSVGPSTLLIDGQAPTEVALRHVWNECLGAGRANEALRADWQAHFREAVDALGARYVRFHGVFHDDMFVYRVGDGGGFGPPTPFAEPVYTFSYVDKVFDAVLAAGARPFVELGFMPRDLATQTETVFWWKAHASPPRDMARWVELVTTTVRHWIERYGIEEVRAWRFEVWNEPNLVPHFWTGTRTQYFELYEATARAIKDIDADLVVGGPSTSVFVPDDRYAGETEDRSAEVATAEATDPDALDWKPVWIHEFVDWCATRGVPVDFLSTHLYPTDYAFDASGQGRPIERHVDATYDDLVVMRAIIEASPFPEAELHISEWSSSPSSRDRMHDTLFAATYITRAFLRGAALADSISYWTFTDVFEEGGAGVGPFHGGFGLVNEHGIHKPTFHAMAMLARLGDRLVLSTPHGVVTRRSADGALAAVFLNYPDEMGTRAIGSRITYGSTRSLADLGPSRRVRHTVEGLAPGTTIAVEVLDWDHGNVAEEWHRMGEPLNLTPQQTARLREVADALHRETLVVPDTGVLEIDLDLRPWAVASLVQDAATGAVER
jgi:xylan 1,4-beta-xylosidase